MDVDGADQQVAIGGPPTVDFIGATDSRPAVNSCREKFFRATDFSV
jgi:hypothetical protein